MYRKAFTLMFALVLCSITGADEVFVGGGWEVSVFLEVDYAVVNSPDVAEMLTIDRTYNLDLMLDGVAYVTDPGGSATEVKWFQEGNIITISYPADDEFQYIEHYQVARVDDWTLIAVIYGPFTGPHVAVMKLTFVGG